MRKLSEVNEPLCIVKQASIRSISTFTSTKATREREGKTFEKKKTWAWECVAKFQRTCLYGDWEYVAKFQRTCRYQLVSFKDNA